MIEKNARRHALESLIKCYANSRYSNLEIDSVLRRVSLSPEDKRLYTALVYGVIEKTVTLDYIIRQFSSIADEKIAVNIRHALRLGIYQILYLDRVPDSAAVNETVELVKGFENKGAIAFLNGVLRAVCRGREEIAARIGRLRGAEYYSVNYSYPLWMAEHFMQSYGEERAEEIMRRMNLPSYPTLRVNTLKTTAAALHERLTADGVRCALQSEREVALLQPYPVEALYGFEDGLFFVQDSASVLAVRLLAPRAGDLVVDPCACPGGKSFSAAMEMENRGTLHAMDLHENKLSLVQSGAKRLGVGIIATRAHNAKTPFDPLLGKADRVICDLPCSGLGVISKKPDIRHKSKEETERLPALQKEILRASSAYLKPGGVLLYSTCTLNPEENERVTEAFFRDHPGFESLHRKTYFPKQETDDGFFIELIRKKERAKEHGI